MVRGLCCICRRRSRLGSVQSCRSLHSGFAKSAKAAVEMTVLWNLNGNRGGYQVDLVGAFLGLGMQNVERCFAEDVCETPMEIC